MSDDIDRSREAEWISRVVAQDDHHAFAQLVRLHQSAVRQFLRRLIGNDWSRADDLAQETFWKAYRHLSSFQGRGRLLSWLFRIAYQLFISAQRVHIEQVSLPLDLTALENANSDFVDSRTFDQLMLLLRPEERAALVLHYRHEMAHPEIAETLGVPLGTVKTLIRRGRLKLEQHCQSTQ